MTESLAKASAGKTIEAGVSNVGMSLRIDVPFKRKDSERRDIGTNLSRLIFDAREGTETNVDAIARLVTPTDMDSSERVFLISSNEFVSAEALFHSMDNSDITHYAEIRALASSNVNAVAEILRQWKAEVLVLMVGRDELVIPAVSRILNDTPKWWKLASTGYEAPFLRRLELWDPVSFFSATRDSVEVIGTRETILQKAEGALELIKHSARRSQSDS